MDSDKKLSEELSTYRDLAKKNKHVDIAKLTMNTLASSPPNLVPPGQRRLAYLVSLSLPPLGLLFALKFYIYSAQDDARHVANVCVVLTVISLVSVWLFGKLVLSGPAANNTGVDQLTNIDLNSLKGMLN